MVFWHGKMLFERQFAIGVRRAGLREVKIVTFYSAGDPTGMVTIQADSSVDAVVAEMYRVFETGRRAAMEQLEHSRRQSERNPNTESRTHLIRLSCLPHRQLETPILCFVLETSSGCRCS